MLPSANSVSMFRTDPFTSTNSSDWIRQDSGVTVSLYDVCFANNQFVAVGEYGTILESGSVERPALSGQYVAGSGVQLTITGGTERTYRIFQSSTDLNSWSDLVVLTNTTGSTHYTDASAREFDRRFYRVLSP